jgi:hypothetical protein
MGSVVATLFFSIFGGGAAFLVGRSTITPVSFAVALLLAHLLLSMFRRADHASLGAKTNGWLAFFCIYGAVTAYLLPKVFNKALAVTPLSASARTQDFLVAPVHLGLQNYTTAIYLLATLAAGVCAGAAAADPKSKRMLVVWGIVIAWVNNLFGLFSAIAPSSAVLKFFRNAAYAELLQSTEDYSRVTGVFPEASAYASFAFMWFVFMIELWLRNVASRWTFVTALGVGAMIIACTSTTGYAALAAYAVILAVRALITPRSIPVSKLVLGAMVGLAAMALALLLINLYPNVIPALGKAAKSILLTKSETVSGRHRLFFAQTAIKAFKVTWGLGVGAGSFRSSSLVLAILGSMGVIGAIAFAGHFIRVLKPLRRDTYELPGDPTKAVGVAAAWAACAGLIPQILSSSTPDPSYPFAIFAGLALGWRYLPRRVPAVQGARPILVPTPSRA